MTLKQLMLYESPVYLLLSMVTSLLAAVALAAALGLLPARRVMSGQAVEGDVCIATSLAM